MSEERARPGLETTFFGDRKFLTIALVTVISALALLVAVPVLVENRIASVRLGHLEVVDLADSESGELGFALARELNLLRAYDSSGDSAWLRSAMEYRDRATLALQRLEDLQPRMYPENAEKAEKVAEAVGRWHDRVDEELRETQGTNVAPPAGISLFEASIAQLIDLRAGLAGQRGRASDRLRRLEEAGLTVTLLLALLALIAVGFVVWLGNRVRRLAEAARVEHRAALQAAEARSRLMRGFSHDLKNPLATVRLAADLLETGIYGDLNPNQADSLGRIQRGADEGLSLLHDIMELASAEAGELRLELAPVDPRLLLLELREDFDLRATAEGLTLRVEIPDGVPPLLGDEKRVRQVLGNLVANAINYTPAGGEITVAAQLVSGGGSATDWVSISVRDTGPGIPPDKIDAVFDEFVRLDGERHRPGSGIGLAISRHLARLMNGRLVLDSELGRGSIFTLQLPRAAVAAAAAAPSSSHPADPQRNYR